MGTTITKLEKTLIAIETVKKLPSGINLKETYKLNVRKNVVFKKS